MHPQKFTPEITTYLTLNGFTKVDECAEIGTLTFRKEDIAVCFWNDKIEKRLISPDKLKVNRVLTSFKGFDGQNILHLMLLLHLMDAVNLKSVNAAVYEKLGVDAGDMLEKEFHLSTVTA